MNQNLNNLGISMRNSTDIVAHSISLVKDNKVVSLDDYLTEVAGEGGGGGGTVDAYNESETDILLGSKLNIENPDVEGTLRIDHVNGNGKIVLNAVNAPNDEDFYVNGLSHLAGTLKFQLLQASSNIETSQQVRSDTYNTYQDANMKIQRNAVDYITLDETTIICHKKIFKI